MDANSTRFWVLFAYSVMLPDQNAHERERALLNACFDLNCDFSKPYTTINVIN